MIMTDEMKKWDQEFQAFLKEVDDKHKDYFISEEIEVDSVTKCFATINGANLKVVPRNLRPDIYDAVINKHKELWGDWHRLDILS
jgi:hypothetical protein